MCERDGGRLWGMSICMPMVIGDARTQTFATSQPPPDAPRPRLIGMLNGPIQWGDSMWAAIMWDTVALQEPRLRSGMFIHESFHIVQMRLGLRVDSVSAEHLDSVDGRYWMRLEWRALARALRESGEPRALAIREALAFRQARHARFPDMVESERAVDINEGLASYTRPCFPRNPRPTRSRARSMGWPAPKAVKASCGRSRTRPGPRMASCSMPRLPAGRDRCAQATTRPRC